MNEKERFIAFLQTPSSLRELRAGLEMLRAEEVQSYLYFLRTPDENLREIAPLLNSIDGFRAGVLALLCGSRVEQGGDVSIPIEAVLNLMLYQLQQVLSYQKVQHDLSSEELFQHFPEATRAHYGLPFTLLAAMTMLSRDAQTRKQWQQRQEVHTLIEELEGLTSEYQTLYYIKEVLALLDNKDLLILDPANERGFLTRLIGVQDRMYHCYALLQHTILEHTGAGYLNAEPTDPDAVRYAQNRDLTEDDYHRSDLSDYQRFSFCYPGALEVTEKGYAINWLGFFPGSASYYEIPAIDGLPILLIGKKQMTFQWEPSNMYPVLHAALASRVRIQRELPHAEVLTWLQRIIQAKRD